MRRSPEVPPRQHKLFNPFVFLVANNRLVDKASSRKFCNALLSSVVLQELSQPSSVSAAASEITSIVPQWTISFPLPPEVCPSHGQALRMKLAMDWDKAVREYRAAVRIQANYRRYRHRKIFVNEVYRRYVAQMTGPAVTIQTGWRRYFSMCSAKVYAFAGHIERVCCIKAQVISNIWKGLIIQRNVKYYLLMRQMKRPMDEACEKIQAGFKGHYTRRLYKQTVEYERRYKSVKWIGPGREVAIIGDMTDPPWLAHLHMDYCRLRHIFVKYFAKLRPGLYYYNYVVDGETRVAREQSVIDHLGSECNVLEVVGEERSRAVLNIPRAFSKDYNDGNTGWSELRKICSESSIELLKQQPAFQTGEMIESSGEYELLRALRESRGDLEPRRDEALLEMNMEEEEKESAKPFGFKDIHVLEPSPKYGSREEKKEAPETPPKDAKQESEDKFAGGKAAINFDLAYDRYEQQQEYTHVFATRTHASCPVPQQRYILFLKEFCAG